MRAKIEIEQDIQHINQELDILLSLEGEERNPEGSVSQEIGRLKNQLERLEVEMQHANRGIIFNPEEEDMLDAEIEADLEAEMYANDIETTKVHFYRDGGEVFSTSSQFSVSKEEVIDLANSVTAFDRSERGADEINDIDGALSILRTKYPEYAELDSSDFYDDEEMDEKFDDYALSSYDKGGKIRVEIVDNLDDHTGYKEGTILEVTEIDDDDYMITKEGYYLSEAEVDFADQESQDEYVKTMNSRYGVGGMLAGFVVGGYAGYKYGLTKRKRNIKDLFSEEQKFAKDYKKRMKKQKEERKKRGEKEYTDYKELKKGGCVDSYANGGKLNSVRVKFKNSKYDYSTSIGANVSEDQARKYFVGMPVNVASYPREKFEEVIDIDYTKGGNYKKGGRMMTEEENPCWKGYQMYGMKKKDGKEVPNCVPEDKKEKGGTTEMPWGTFENSIEVSGTYWDGQISANNSTLRRMAQVENKSFDELREGWRGDISDKELYEEMEKLREHKAELQAENLHLYDNFGGEKEYLKWKKEQKESQELPFEKGGLLKQTSISSQEYQKAKKLKDFKKEDYKWSSDKDLYVRKDALTKPISIKRGRDSRSSLRRMYGFEKGGETDLEKKDSLYWNEGEVKDSDYSAGYEIEIWGKEPEEGSSEDRKVGFEETYSDAMEVLNENHKDLKEGEDIVIRLSKYADFTKGYGEEIRYTRHYKEDRDYAKGGWIEFKSKREINKIKKELEKKGDTYSIKFDPDGSRFGLKGGGRYRITSGEYLSTTYAKGGLLRVLKDSGFNNHKGMPKNELKHNRGQYIATIGKDNMGEVVHLDKYTPNTKRFISSTSFDNPKKLADYFNKNQLYAKGGKVLPSLTLNDWKGGTPDSRFDKLSKMIDDRNGYGSVYSYEEKLTEDPNRKNNGLGLELHYELKKFGKNASGSGLWNFIQFNYPSKHKYRKWMKDAKDIENFDRVIGTTSQEEVKHKKLINKLINDTQLQKDWKADAGDTQQHWYEKGGRVISVESLAQKLVRAYPRIKMSGLSSNRISIYEPFPTDRKGNSIADYYSESEDRTFGIARHFDNFLERNGYWAEWVNPEHLKIWKKDYAEGGNIDMKEEKIKEIEELKAFLKTATDKEDIEQAKLSIEELENEIMYNYAKGGFLGRLFGGKPKKSEKAKKLRIYNLTYIISDKKGKPIIKGNSSRGATSRKEAHDNLKKSLQENIDSGYYEDGDKIEIFTAKQYKQSGYDFEKGGTTNEDYPFDVFKKIENLKEGALLRFGNEIWVKIGNRKDQWLCKKGPEKGVISDSTVVAQRVVKSNKSLKIEDEYEKGGSVRRTNNSPLLRYTNFEDGWVFNLVKLETFRNQEGLRYKGNNKYGISRQGPGKKQEVWQFETLQEADKKYDELVELGKTYSKIEKQGKVKNNYAKGGEILLYGENNTNDFSAVLNEVYKDGKLYKGKAFYINGYNGYDSTWDDGYLAIYDEKLKKYIYLNDRNGKYIVNKNGRGNSVDLSKERKPYKDDYTGSVYDYAKGGMISVKDTLDEAVRKLTPNQKKIYNRHLERTKKLGDSFTDDSLADYVNGWYGEDIVDRMDFSGVKSFNLGYKVVALNMSQQEDDFWEFDDDYAKGGSLMTRIEAEQEIKKLKKKIKSLKKKEGDFDNRGAWNNFRAEKIKPLEDRVIEISDDINTGNVRYDKGGVIKKGDYVRDARGELGLVNKVKKGVAYVKYPSTNQNAFEPVFLDEIKETKDMYRGRKVYTDFYDK